MYVTVISSFTMDCPYRLCEGASPGSNGRIGPLSVPRRRLERRGVRRGGTHGAGNAPPAAEEAVASRFMTRGILVQASTQRQEPGVRPHSLIRDAIFLGSNHSVDRLKVEKIFWWGSCPSIRIEEHSECPARLRRHRRLHRASGWRTIARVSDSRIRFVVVAVHENSSAGKLTAEEVVLAHDGRHFRIRLVSVDGMVVIESSAVDRGIEEDRGTIAREAGHVAVDEQPPVAEERLDNLMASARARAPDHSGVDVVVIVPAPENDGRPGGREPANQGVRSGSVERGVGLNRGSWNERDQRSALEVIAGGRNAERDGKVEADDHPGVAGLSRHMAKDHDHQQDIGLQQQVEVVCEPPAGLEHGIEAHGEIEDGWGELSEERAAAPQHEKWRPGRGVLEVPQQIADPHEEECAESIDELREVHVGRQAPAGKLAQPLQQGRPETAIGLGHESQDICPEEVAEVPGCTHYGAPKKKRADPEREQEQRLSHERASDECPAGGTVGNEHESEKEEQRPHGQSLPLDERNEPKRESHADEVRTFAADLVREPEQAVDHYRDEEVDPMLRAIHHRQPFVAVSEEDQDGKKSHSGDTAGSKGAKREVDHDPGRREQQERQKLGHAIVDTEAEHAEEGEGIAEQGATGSGEQRQSERRGEIACQRRGDSDALIAVQVGQPQAGPSESEEKERQCQEVQKILSVEGCFWTRTPRRSRTQRDEEKDCR